MHFKTLHYNGVAIAIVSETRIMGVSKDRHIQTNFKVVVRVVYTTCTNKYMRYILVSLTRHLNCVTANVPALTILSISLYISTLQIKVFGIHGQYSCRLKHYLI